jgi:hypothetical protein
VVDSHTGHELGPSPIPDDQIQRDLWHDPLVANRLSQPHAGRENDKAEPLIHFAAGPGRACRESYVCAQVRSSRCCRPERGAVVIAKSTRRDIDRTGDTRNGPRQPSREAPPRMSTRELD